MKLTNKDKQYLILFAIFLVIVMGIAAIYFVLADSKAEHVPQDIPQYAYDSQAKTYTVETNSALNEMEELKERSRTREPIAEQKEEYYDYSYKTRDYDYYEECDDDFRELPYYLYDFNKRINDTDDWYYRHYYYNNFKNRCYNRLIPPYYYMQDYYRHMPSIYYYPVYPAYNYGYYTLGRSYYNYRFTKYSAGSYYGYQSNYGVTTYYPYNQWLYPSYPQYRVLY